MACSSPPTPIFGVNGLRCQDAGDLLPQNWATIPGGPPDHVPVDPEVCVDKNITEGYDLWPRYLRVAGCEFFGDSRSGFAYNREFLNYGAAE